MPGDNDYGIGDDEKEGAHHCDDGVDNDMLG